MSLTCEAALPLNRVSSNAIIKNLLFIFYSLFFYILCKTFSFRMDHLIASVMIRSVFSNSSLKGMSFTAIGSCIINSRVLPIVNGNDPHLVIFHELLIVTGKTNADGEYLQRIFNPFSAKGLGLAVLLRVPSGKITTERLCSSMYLPIS